jgi:site-specific recombinase XerD
VKTETARKADPSDLAALVPAWKLSLRAANKSPKTIKAYLEAGTQLHAYLAAQGMPTNVPAIRREHVEAFIVELTTTKSASTAATRYRALQQLWRWLLEEGEVTASPMANMRPPAVEDAPVPVLDLEDCKRLLKACEGTTFDDRRDAALIRVLLDCGLRRAEAIGMTVDDVDLDDSVLTVLGKGRRTRHVSFGAKTASALSRYERARLRHRHAELDAYWLGTRGSLTDSGLAQVLRRRCVRAGLDPIHPHVLRHTWAHSMLALGHAEGNLRVLGGWRTRDMLDRYGASVAAERARDAHRAKSPGDLL